MMSQPTYTVCHTLVMSLFCPYLNDQEQLNLHIQIPSFSVQNFKGIACIQCREVLYLSLPSSFVVVLMFTLKIFRIFIFIYLLIFWNWVTVSRCGFFKNWSYSASVSSLNLKASRSFLLLFLWQHFLHFETSVNGIFGLSWVVFLSSFLYYNFGFSFPAFYIYGPTTHNLFVDPAALASPGSLLKM